LKDFNSTTWYWEETGAEIADFYWGDNQPDLDAFFARSCIEFSFLFGGWDDEVCVDYAFNAMCQ